MSRLQSEDDDAASVVVVLGPNHFDSFAENIAETFRASAITATAVSPFSAMLHATGINQYGSVGRNIQRILSRLPPVEDRLMQSPIAAALRAANPRLVISVYGHFPANLVEKWRAVTPNATWVLWYPDALANLGSHKSFLAPWDLLFFKEPALVDLLASRTALPVALLPEACNPAIHRTETWASPAERQRYSCDIVVAGNLYAYRLLILEELPSDVSLRIYGTQPTLIPRFDRFRECHAGEVVRGRTKALAFQGARIVLNTMHYSEIRAVNCRLFEGAACGGFMLTHPAPELGRYFEDGLEVVTFETGSQLRDAVRYYLSSEAAMERTRIAAAGQRRAHSQHTYRHRLHDLVHRAGLGLDPAFAALAH